MWTVSQVYKAQGRACYPTTVGALQLTDLAQQQACAAKLVIIQCLSARRMDMYICSTASAEM